MSHSPVTSVGSPPPFLPPDLEAGFTAAEFLLLHVEHIVDLLTTARLSGWPR